MNLARLVKILPVEVSLKLIRAIRSLRGPAPEPRPEPTEERFSPPFIVAEACEAGDLLVMLGPGLYLWTEGGKLPPAFRAKRAIRAGEQVFNDPTNPARSDLEVLGPSQSRSIPAKLARPALPHHHPG